MGVGVIFDATVDGRTLRVEVRGKDGRYTVGLDGTPFEVEVAAAGPHLSSLIVDGESHEVGLARRPGGVDVVLAGEAVAVDLTAGAASVPPRRAHGPARLVSPMPGRVVRVLCAPGGEVAAGQGLLVVEAMKMENEIRAPRAGVVGEVAVREGQAVEAGALLVVVA
jgi:biotin carboxyl carrier protein